MELVIANVCAMVLGLELLVNIVTYTRRDVVLDWWLEVLAYAIVLEIGPARDVHIVHSLMDPVLAKQSLTPSNANVTACCLNQYVICKLPGLNLISKNVSVDVHVTMSLSAVMAAIINMEDVMIAIPVLLEIIATTEFAQDITCALGKTLLLKDLHIIQSHSFLQLYPVLPFSWALLEQLLQS